MKERNNNKKGISLIVLVITIVLNCFAVVGVWINKIKNKLRLAKIYRLF